MWPTVSHWICTQMSLITPEMKYCRHLIVIFCFSYFELYILSMSLEIISIFNFCIFSLMDTKTYVSVHKHEREKWTCIMREIQKPKLHKFSISFVILQLGQVLKSTSKYQGKNFMSFN